MISTKSSINVKLFLSSKFELESGLTWCWRGKEPRPPGDGVALDLVTPGKLLPVRGRQHGHRHAVPPAPGVSPGPGDQQQVFRLSLLLNVMMMSNVNNEITLDLFVMKLREGVAGEASPPGLAVLHQGQVVLLLGG